MSQFNKPNQMPKAYSANGNPQFVKSLEQQAYELVVGSLYGKDTFYETSGAKSQRLSKLISELVAAGNLDFLANLMVFARVEMGIRNMPIFGMVEFVKALRKSNTSYAAMRKLVSAVIGRVDQITDTLALLGTKEKMPMALKRGLSDAFNKFNEYQFAKYNRKDKVTLKDAMRIVHPVPVDEDKSGLFAKIMSGELKTPDTWEVALSRDGNTKQVWEGLIERKALGAQATLKNLRNMLEVGISLEHKRMVALEIAKAATNHKTLPFEFLAAMKAIDAYSDQVFKTALIEAMDYSAQNVPFMGNKVLVILDTSGSMRGLASETSCFLTAVLAKACKNSEEFTVINFASSAKFEMVNTAEGVFSTYQNLLRKVGGGSTNFEAALELVNRSTTKYDTVFVFTDNEIDRLQYASSCASFQVRAERYVINCAASKTSCLPSFQGWNQLAGFSTNMFKYMGALREGQNMLKMLSQPFPYNK